MNTQNVIAGITMSLDGFTAGVSQFVTQTPYVIHT